MIMANGLKPGDVIQIHGPLKMYTDEPVTPINEEVGGM